jgi:hypothetical protein
MSSTPKPQKDNPHKLGRVLNMTVNVGKQCRNILRRHRDKASQALCPQDASPAILESVGDNASTSISDPIFAPVLLSTEAAIVQANAEKTKLTQDSQTRLGSKEIALPREQGDGTAESNDLEIRPISDTILTTDDVADHTTPGNSSKVPKRDDLEITPRVGLVRAFDQGPEQPIHGNSGTENTLRGAAATRLDNAQLTNDVGASEDPDTKRTLHRYEKAKQQIRESLKFCRNEWGSFIFPEVDTLSEQEELSALLNAIDKVLDRRSQKDSVMNPTKWEKCKKVVANIFTATSPFAKNLLTIAKEGAQIPIMNPYGLLFGGLMLLITVRSL